MNHNLNLGCFSFAFNTFRAPPTAISVDRVTRCRIAMNNSVSVVHGRTLVSIAACSALLGPLLDNFHSQFGILAYKHPVELHLNIAGVSASLTTAPFTPPLFALAGVIIAYGTLILNNTFRNDKFLVLSINGLQAVATISAFSSIYYISAAIPNSELAPLTGPLLTLLALAEWYFMDKSIGGLMMGVMTGVCGPLIEIGLINIGGLYSYSSPEMFGIPLFIAAVYFAGGPAVGNLARTIDEFVKMEVAKGKS